MSHTLKPKNSSEWRGDFSEKPKHTQTPAFQLGMHVRQDHQHNECKRTPVSIRIKPKIARIGDLEISRKRELMPLRQRRHIHSSNGTVTAENRAVLTRFRCVFRNFAIFVRTNFRDSIEQVGSIIRHFQGGRTKKPKNAQRLAQFSRKLVSNFKHFSSLSKLRIASSRAHNLHATKRLEQRERANREKRDNDIEEQQWFFAGRTLTRGAFFLRFALYSFSSLRRCASLDSSAASAVALSLLRFSSSFLRARACRKQRATFIQGQTN